MLPEADNDKFGPLGGVLEALLPNEQFCHKVGDLLTHKQSTLITMQYEQIGRNTILRITLQNDSHGKDEIGTTHVCAMMHAELRRDVGGEWSLVNSVFHEFTNGMRTAENDVAFETIIAAIANTLNLVLQQNWGSPA